MATTAWIAGEEQRPRCGVGQGKKGSSVRVIGSDDYGRSTTVTEGKRRQRQRRLEASEESEEGAGSEGRRQQRKARLGRVGSDCSNKMAEEEGGDGSDQKGNDGNSRWSVGRGCVAAEQRRQGRRVEVEEGNDVVGRGRGQRPRTCTRGRDWKKTTAKDLRQRARLEEDNSPWLRMVGVGGCCDREAVGEEQRVMAAGAAAGCSGRGEKEVEEAATAAEVAGKRRRQRRLATGAGCDCGEEGQRLTATADAGGLRQRKTEEGSNSIGRWLRLGQGGEEDSLLFL
ncbi:hypothetical protein B296_00037543 [Ensete ventricosum]|uniref:Uncharacterized protein n=1 Tax=Ensete ventricosum TaxID=4639 RepID=A0A426ZZC8_ENSVE|nr:hypothetical protein B296_00037543 [Ensete ventricosum]